MVKDLLHEKPCPSKGVRDENYVSETAERRKPFQSRLYPPRYERGQLRMGQNSWDFKKIGKIVAWFACTFGGFGGFLQWIGIKPKDLAMTQSIPIPDVLWLLRQKQGEGVPQVADRCWANVQSNS
jgi:hypothetical protein